MPVAVIEAGLLELESEPPFQTIVPVLLADNEIVLFVQVKFPGGEMVTVGGGAIVD